MLWPIVWGTFMLGLVVTTIVVAMREKKAQAQAIKNLAPQPLGEDPTGGDMMSDGFGEADPLDSFQ
ncbi:MAG: hypothetical protein KDB22_01975 [Planctomycetales bacterium]|nr:hypothetical protein [Planctomycetales bacterium]